MPRILADLVYRPEHARGRLDLILPDSGAGFPTLVWFHGGGLTSGDKTDMRQLGGVLAAAGIAVAAANYRFSPAARFPAYLDDAAAAVAWVLANISAHGGDRRRIVVGGHSAGAYLAAMLGLDASRLAAHGVGTAQLAGVVPVSGQLVTHFAVRAERSIPATQLLVDAAAPLAHVRSDAPPFLLIAADSDIPPRPEENRYLAASLRALGATAAYREIAGRDHNTIMERAVEAGDPLQTALVAFVGA